MFLLVLSTICVFLVDNGNVNNVSIAKSTNTSDIQLMARAINGEARGEPYEGQVAVGAVILNRVKDSRFPNSIYKAAQDALNGWDPTGGCVYYFNPATATNKWIWSRPLVKTIGKHRFCK